MTTTTTATVLIVEDDIALNDAYQLILHAQGFTVHSAYNGREALDLLATLEQQPDVILLDLRMPVMSGIEFLREYQPATHPETNVIVFSNYDAHKDIDEAYELGVNRYVLKARIAPNDLKHLIDGVLNEALQAD
ncbi:MAG: response regulator [Candidatus Saccharimonas sp.]